MEKTLTGNRDPDLIILSKLSDRDLLSFCSVNRYGKILCENEDFWANRFRKNFGNIIAKYKPKTVTWKNIYLQTIRELNMEASDLKNLDGLIIVWEDSLVSKKFIQYCEKIKAAKNHILVVNSGIRSNLFPVGAAWNTCAICQNSLFDFVEDLPKNYKLKDKIKKICIINNIDNLKEKLDGKSFNMYINSPLVKGKCGHVYHHGCMNWWLEKSKNFCPLDNQKWDTIMMDSYISVHFEKLWDVVEEIDILQIYEQKKKAFKIDNPNVPFESFQYFKYKIDPYSDKSIEMFQEYENRKTAYINSFHDRFPNSPSNPIYPPFNLFDYDIVNFPRSI